MDRSGRVTLLAFAFALGAACGGDDAPPKGPPPPTTVCSPPAREAMAVALAPALGDAKFAQPVEMVFGPQRRFYVLEQEGRVRVVPPAGGQPTVALDLTGRVQFGGEAGLLGIAFDPKFADNGFVYLHFNQNVDDKRDVPFQSLIVRFTSRDGGDTFDPATEKLVLEVDQPFSNHNGGRISFGPDGLLYIGFGDGGSGGDPLGNGQNKDVLLGKILRIDPSPVDQPYAIPPTNPFAAGGGRPEVYAYGLRNPWKHSFDMATGELWVADVGQSKYEEVNRVVLGGNYGWNVREGRHCYNADTCATEGLIDPVAEYPRAEGTSVTGGYVYRGTRIPGLIGKFVYGDFGSGNIWAADGLGPLEGALLTDSNLRISSFGQDGDGEIYVVDYSSGTIKQLVAAPAPPAPVAGAHLAETRCLDTQNPAAAPSGAIPFSVNSPLWSDGAQKDRWLFVPEGEKIAVRPDGDFDVPPGSVVVKTFTASGKKVETRLLVRYADGGWAGYSYEWNDAQTDADLLPDHKTKPLPDGSSWYFPSRGECFVCHTSAAGFTLGLEARQLNRDDGTGNVLDRFAGVLEAPVAKEAFPPLRAADAPGASAEERARGYLHANCSVCHRDGSGTGAATIDLRVDRALLDTRMCDVAPQGGDLGVPNAKLIAPGDPARSILTLRMRTREEYRMPPLATSVVDEVGATAVEDWIRALTACP